VQPIYKSGKTLLENSESSVIEIALCYPQIPQNTGSIARLCAAFKIMLHLIEPMGFQITEKSVRRAGLDYWQYVNLYIHNNWQNFNHTRSNRRFIFIETGTQNDPFDFEFLPNDILIFGAETFGIPKEIIAKVPKENILTIPMYQSGVRSINLANTVSIVLYLAMSQIIRYKKNTA
jgi:tRNA (cytidine/uridine-2'-O-)-methyltransferase